MLCAKRLLRLSTLSLLAVTGLTGCFWNTAPRKDFTNQLNARVNVTTATGEQLSVAYTVEYEAEFTNATDAYDWTVTRHTGNPTRGGTFYNHEGFAPFVKILGNRIKNMPRYTDNDGKVTEQFEQALDTAFEQSAQQFNDQTKWVDVADEGIAVVKIVSLKETALDNANKYWSEVYGSDAVPNFSSKGVDTDGDGFVTVSYIEQAMPNEWGRVIYGYLNCSGTQEAGSCEPHQKKMAERFTPEELANRQLNFGGNTEAEVKLNK